MAYVIAEPCIGTKDRACVDACPVDCIHPKADEPGGDTLDQLFIDPVECIDCGACVPVCPVSELCGEECRPLRAVRSSIGFARARSVCCALLYWHPPWHL
jgi:NAD-dependent dihydropyrimidine dehydrogenase PreA subunit